MSLTARLGLAMAAAAAVSALLAGALTAPLLADASSDALRAPLGRQADLLSRLPLLALTGPRGEAVAERHDLEVGVVLPDGRPQGVAAVLTDAELADLEDGRRVSSTGTLDGRTVLVEARPGRGGGAVVLVADDSIADAAARGVRRRVLLALGVGLLAGLGAAWVLARRVARPLSQTAAAARRMADGERGVPLPDSSLPEVRDVTSALGSLDRALVGSEDRQRRFLLSVSHELRTPLTAVRGYAEALADGVVPPEETPEVGRTLGAEAARLERYVTDLLRLARLQVDGFSVEPRDTDLAPTLRAAVAAWGAATGEVEVVAEIEDALPLRTDPDRVRQVLDALVDNATRVCSPGDRVVVAGRRVDTGVRLEVRDSGPGLTDDDLAVAFDPGVLHERYADSGSVRRAGSHGIGLAVVRQLVAALGGTVNAAHAREGGAAFVVDLPEAAQPTAAGSSSEMTAERRLDT